MGTEEFIGLGREYGIDLIVGDVQRLAVIRPILDEAKKQGVRNFAIGDGKTRGVIFHPHGLASEENGFIPPFEPFFPKVDGILCPGPRYYRKALEGCPKEYHNRIKMSVGQNLIFFFLRKGIKWLKK